ncbi:MAG TPA: hypothetical protein VMN58_03585 [Acidimicrobiales bacterium]|nr:hypothetical protein [Acidimicrobiales bacterium]
MDDVMARKMWRTLEPYHGMIYFAPEATEAYASVGLAADRMGYFASRAAPMGAVTGEVVVATFFNFNPDVVARAIPAAWERASPGQILGARIDAADRALRRMLGDDVVEGTEVAEAAELARTAALACRPEGRPLFAGHSSLPWPLPPHLVLWHAISLLREFRGDGHIAAMTVEGVGGCEALVIHGASGDVPAAVLQASRAWPDDDWQAATERLQARGWLDADGALTEAGRAHRQWVEDRTDALALAPWEALGSDACDRLRDLVRPWSKAIVAAGAFGG